MHHPTSLTSLSTVSPRAKQIFFAFPFIFLLAILVHFYPSIIGAIKYGFSTNVNGIKLITKTTVAAFIINLTILSIFNNNAKLSIWLASAVTYSLVYFLSGYFSSFFIVIFYVCGIFQITKLFSKLFRQRFSIQELALLTVSINYFLTEVIYLFGYWTKEFPYLICSLGAASILKTIWCHLKVNQLDFNLIKAKNAFRFSIHNIQLAVISSIVLTFGALLTLQPIIEWDSSLGHIPTIAHYYNSGKILPNPHILQSYAYNFHHVASLPFFSLAHEFGLRLFNFINIHLVFLSLYWLIQKALNKTEYSISTLLVCFAVITGSPILSSAGTIQYDIPLAFFSCISLFFLIQFLDQKSHETRERPLLFGVLSISLGVLTKLSFLNFAFIYSVALIPILLLRRVIPKLSFALGSFFAILLLLKPYLFSGDPLFPNNFILKASTTNLKSWGIHENSWLVNLAALIPMATFKTELYAEMRRFSLGFAPLLSFLFLPFFLAKKRFLPFSLIVISTTALFSFQTQYIRYYIFLLVPFAVFAAAGVSYIKKQTWPIVSTLANVTLIVITLVQIFLLPNMNWWVRINGTALAGQYSERQEFEKLRDPEWKNLNEISRHINERAILFSKYTPSKYFWANLIPTSKIVPWTWQSMLKGDYPNSESALLASLKLNGFSEAILPKDEALASLLNSKMFKIRIQNEQFLLIKVSDSK